MIESAGLMEHRIFPERLRPGDTVAVVGPASSLPEEECLAKGERLLEDLGYRVCEGSHLHDRRLLFCGGDRDRAEDINRAFADRGVKAIFCAKGGCGTSRMVPFVDYKTIAQNPKIFVGYSDITALHCAIAQRTGLVTFYGPMVATEIGADFPPFTEKHFFAILSSGEGSVVLENNPDREAMTLYPGKAEGQLTGGCLSIVAASLGTKDEIDTKGRLLFLEDIDEAPHRIDRYLTQLIQAGKIEEAEGVVFGAFTRCEYPEDHGYSGSGVTVLDIVTDLILPLRKPCVWGLQFGHEPEKLTIPVNALASLDATERKLTVEPCVR